MRLNQTIEDALGSGDCHIHSAPAAVAHHHHVTTDGGSGAPEVRPSSLRINHAHEELMGMCEHPGARE